MKKPTTSSLAAPLALLAALIGCGESAPASPAPVPAVPAAPAAPRELTEVELVALMEGHYTSAIAAHDALIRGDVLTVRTRLAEIAAQELPANAPASWRPLHARLHTAASGAAPASTLEEAGAAMGAVVEACGSCHASLGRGPEYLRPLAPEGATPLETAMLGHQWATERLWEAVTGPREEAWHRGAATLAASRVFAARTGEVSPALLARETAMKHAGEAALTIAGLHERSAAYGQLLATCAGCHREASVSFDAIEH